MKKKQNHFVKTIFLFLFLEHYYLLNFTTKLPRKQNAFNKDFKSLDKVEQQLQNVQKLC